MRPSLRSNERRPPQGSVCAPLLWLCYINDLAPMLRRHNVEVGLYADDLDISATDRDVREARRRVQAALDELHEWAETWGMHVSETKTKSILFTTHRDEVNAKLKLNMCLGQKVLEQVEVVTVLGVKFDTQLTFRQHIESTKTKADKRIGAMKALAGTRWGCREIPCENSTNHSYVQSSYMVAAPTYPSRPTRTETR